MGPYQVRKSVTDDGLTLWRIWDLARQVWIITYSQRALAEATVAVLNRRAAR